MGGAHGTVRTGNACHSSAPVAATGAPGAARHRAYRVQVSRDEVPLDPFAGDPDDPAQEFRHLDEQVADTPETLPPLTNDERADVLEDLVDLEGFRSLLEPRGVRGLVVDCVDCREPHYFNWDLLQSNLRHLLDTGEPRVHEPAFDPDPTHYESWDYARGFADATLALADDDAAEPTPPLAN